MWIVPKGSDVFLWELVSNKGISLNRGSISGVRNWPTRKKHQQNFKGSWVWWITTGFTYKISVIFPDILLIYSEKIWSLIGLQNHRKLLINSKKPLWQHPVYPFQEIQMNLSYLILMIPIRLLVKSYHLPKLCIIIHTQLGYSAKKELLVVVRFTIFQVILPAV